MTKRGFGIAEVIVAAALISASIYGLLSVSQNFLRLSRETSHSVKASYLLEEGVEAIRSIRDRGWTANITPLLTDTTYYLHWDGEIWEATTTPELIDDFFTRVFVVDNVYRDANDDIAETGTLDPDTKKFTVSVSWPTQSGATTARSVSTYYTNFFND